MRSLTILAAVGVAMLVLAGCGGGGAKQTPMVALKAEACTKGEGPESKLYIRNLDDYEWREITFTIMKGDGAYTREWPSLVPENEQPSEPLTDSLSFKWDSDVSVGELSSGRGSASLFGPQILRLRFFNNLDSAGIEINSPQPGEWSGDISRCQ